MSRPVAIVFSVLAALQIITAGSVLADLVGAERAAAVALVVAAAQAGMAFYVQAQVTPHKRVAAWKDPAKGVVVAGPANPARITEGKQVDISEASPTQWA